MNEESPAAVTGHPRRVAQPALAMLLALLTLILGAVAFHQATSQSKHPVTFRIHGDLHLTPQGLGDLNITQEAVERAAEQHGLRTHRPFTLEVVGRELTTQERLGQAKPAEIPDDGQSPPAQVLLSLGEPELYADRGLAPTKAVAIQRINPSSRQQHQDSAAIADVLKHNITAGHGPGAVVAAAEMAVQRLQPPPAPLPWAAGAAISLGLTFFAFQHWYRRRSAREAELRTLATAQQRLARVVLDLEALEATYLTVDQARLPESMRENWDRLQRTTRRMLEHQPALEAAVERGDPVGEKTADRDAIYPLEWFRDDAIELTALANTLMESVPVHGGLAGSRRPLEQLLAPIHAAVGELQTRLDSVLRSTPWTAPAGLTTADRTALSAGLEEVLHARGELLALAGTGGAAHQDLPPEQLLDQWRAAEQRLIQSVLPIIRRLRRRDGRVVLHLRDVRHLTAQQLALRLTEHAPPQDTGLTAEQGRVRLREALGLPADAEERPLDTVEMANLVTRARLGNHPELDAGAPQLDLPGPGRDGGPIRPTHAPTQKALRTAERTRSNRQFVLGLAGVLTVLATAAALANAAYTSVKPPPLIPELSGTEQLTTLTIDDRTGGALGLTEDLLREHLQDRFTETVHLTVAVREIGSYLEHQRHPDHSGRMQLDYVEAVRALWTLKGEFPELTDPVTGELRPGQVILPVMVLPDDRYSVLVPAAGTLSLGDGSRLGAYDFQLTSPTVRASDRGQQLTYDIEGVARALQLNEVYRNQSNPAVLAWTVFAAVCLLGAVALRILQLLGRVASGLGGFGRHGTRLREAARRVDLLALDADDSRQFAVVVGDTQDAVGQRLFDRTLVLALREVESLRMVPRAERLGREFGHRVQMLERRIQMLEHWDQQTDARTEELLAAARERW